MNGKLQHFCNYLQNANKMELYLISQNSNKKPKACKSAVVIAFSEMQARKRNPLSGECILESCTNSDRWVDSTKYVTVLYLGQASTRYREPTTICYTLWAEQ